MSQNKKIKGAKKKQDDNSENIPPPSTSGSSSNTNKNTVTKNVGLLITTKKLQERLELEKSRKQVLSQIQDEAVAGPSSVEQSKNEENIDVEPPRRTRRSAAPVWLGISDDEEDYEEQESVQVEPKQVQEQEEKEQKQEEQQQARVKDECDTESNTSDVNNPDNKDTLKEEVPSTSKSKSKSKATGRIFITEKFLGIVGETMTPDLRAEAVDKINLELAKLDPKQLGSKKLKKKKMGIKDRIVNEMINNKFVYIYDTPLDLATTNQELMKKYELALKSLPEDDPRVERLAKYLATHVGL